jgi:hypothetical protein
MNAKIREHAMATSFNRLHLATRIHFGLLRTLGEGIDVARMLRQRGYADLVLDVCRGVGEFSIVELADRFDDATAEESARECMAEAAREARRALALIPRRAPPVTAQDMNWSDHTSGFGLTQAMAALDDAPEVSATPTRRRFAPPDWLGLGTARDRH